jgi:hypothetical protein
MPDKLPNADSDVRTDRPAKSVDESNQGELPDDDLDGVSGGLGRVKGPPPPPPPI